MAIDFNATTSKLEHTTANLSITNLFTVCAWVLADGLGEGTVGRIIVLDENANSIIIGHHTVANVLKVHTVWSGGNCIWTFPATDGVWNAVAISLDSSLISNAPIVRVNFAAVTVTVDISSSGTYTTPATGFCVGNQTAADRTWDGAIGYVQVWNEILTAQQMDSALRAPGSVGGTKLFVTMDNTEQLQDLSGQGNHPTATSLTDRAGPQCRPFSPWPQRLLVQFRA